MRRTDSFTLDTNAHLYRRGLRWAMLGVGAPGVLAFDSGPLRARGTMTGIDSDDWLWDDELQRWVLDFASGDNYVDFGMMPILGTGEFSVTGWIKPDSTGAWDGPIVGWGDFATDHHRFELNIDSNGYCHANQATLGNANTFFGAFVMDVWSPFVYSHYKDTSVSLGDLWVGGKEATGGGTGTTDLDIVDGGDYLRSGSSHHGGAFNLTAQMTDLMIFDQALGEFEATLLARREDVSLGGLLVAGSHANAYDLESIR